MSPRSSKLWHTSRVLSLLEKPQIYGRKCVVKYFKSRLIIKIHSQGDNPESELQKSKKKNNNKKEEENFGGLETGGGAYFQFLCNA